MRHNDTKIGRAMRRCQADRQWARHREWSLSRGFLSIEVIDFVQTVIYYQVRIDVKVDGSLRLFVWSSDDLAVINHCSSYPLVQRRNGWTHHFLVTG